MRVALVANPTSGRGRALPLREAVAAALAARGHEPVPLGLSEAVRVREADAAVVFGGDGTLHGVLPALADGPPVYHAPLGTENLFAREFAMRPDAGEVCSAVDRAASRTIDLGEAACLGASRPFVVMLSVGPDAGVIRRLHMARRGPITHAAYIAPILGEALRPSLAPLTIVADGREVIRAATGTLVVANLRQYGLRIDPAPDADPADGLLDLVFMPCTTGLGVLARTLASRLRRHGAAVVRLRARAFEVRSERSVPVQADGECMPWGEGGLDLRLWVRPGAMRVLGRG